MVAVLEERCSDGFESSLEGNEGEMMVYCDVWERVGIAQDGNNSVKVQGRKPKHKPEVQPRRRPKAEDYPPATTTRPSTPTLPPDFSSATRSTITATSRS